MDTFQNWGDSREFREEKREKWSHGVLDHWAGTRGHWKNGILPTALLLLMLSRDSSHDEIVSVTRTDTGLQDQVGFGGFEKPLAISVVLKDGVALIARAMTR